METRLQIGQRIDSYGDIWEVLELLDGEKPQARIKVHGVSLFQRYLDVGAEYLAFQHKPWGKNPTETWEIPPEQMKRSSSQVLMFWFLGDSEPCFELDT